jgi:hypothetical protein
MGDLTSIALLAGGFFGALVGVALLVAGWELLRQRDMLVSMRRDRAVYAASAPLPLSAAVRAGLDPAAARRRADDAPEGASGDAAAAAGAPGAAPAKREPNWIETRPMVISRAPAVDDNLALRQREPDLKID